MLPHHRLHTFLRSGHARFLRTALALLAALVHTPGFADVPADVITVGNGGFPANCTTATLQDAVNLAKNQPGPSRIWVSRNTANGYYLPWNAVAITNQDLEIVGGFDDCFDEAPSGFTTISGSGGSLDPVLRIRGGGVVRLTNLDITLGDADVGEGGGIDYLGTGSLILMHDLIRYNHDDFGAGGGLRFRADSANAYLFLDDVVVSDNSAASGGGISVGHTASAGRPFVEFGNNVRIESNTAVFDGGGAKFEQDSTLTMLGQANSVKGNRASNGGGFYLSPGTVANIAAGDSDSIGLFRDNASSSGGAIYANGAQLYLHSRTDHKALTLVANQASAWGGAIFASALSTVCLKDVNLQLNTARRYGALYLNGSSLYWNRGCTIPNALPITCTTSDYCNAVSSNTSTVSHSAESNDTIGLEAGGHAEFARVHFRLNTADWLIRPGTATVDVYDSVIAQNLTRRGLVWGALTTLSGTTITGNNDRTPDGANFYIMYNFDSPSVSTQMRDTLVDQPNAILTYYKNAVVPDRLMSNTRDPQDYWPAGSYLKASPVFDPANAPRVYVQSPLSPGVDAAPARGGVDIDGNPRDFDISGIDNGHGPRDIGAFERMDTSNYDRIFRSSFGENYENIEL